MKRPQNYPLNWYGEEYELLSGSQLVLSDRYIYLEGDEMVHERIAGSQVAFLCEELPNQGGCDYITGRKTRELLHLRSSPNLHEVIEQLKFIITQFNSSSPPQFEWINCSCKCIYQFTIDKPGVAAASLEDLREIPCIWNESKFLHSSCVARNWTLSDGPYLYTAPPTLSAHRKFTRFIGVKEHFTSQDAINALQAMKSDSGSQPIDKSSERLLTELVSIFLKSSEDLMTVKGTIYLPDMKNVLHKSSDLVFNDHLWMRAACK